MTIAPELAAAIEAAFDFRGDVTVYRADGTSEVGYLYNRTTRPTQEFPVGHVEMFRAADGSRAAIGYDQIARIEHTGQDHAQAGA